MLSVWGLLNRAVKLTLTYLSHGHAQEINALLKLLSVFSSKISFFLINAISIVQFHWKDFKEVFAQILLGEIDQLKYLYVHLSDLYSQRQQSNFENVSQILALNQTL